MLRWLAHLPFRIEISDPKPSKDDIMHIINFTEAMIIYTLLELMCHQESSLYNGQEQSV